MTLATQSAVFALLAGMVASPIAPAQQLPPPAQGQQMLQQALQQNPALADEIRNRIQASGLTPDQVRARLAASGYPTNLLDAYLGAAAPGQATVNPSGSELAAIQALGLSARSMRDESQRPATPSADAIAPESLAAGNYVFGLDVFRRSSTQFLPVLAGPVPPDYRLGAGDELVLILTGDVELAYTLPVTREGFILIPQVGQVFVSHVTLDQARDLLYARLGRVYSSVRRGLDAKTHVELSVANVRVNQIYVVGEVRQPGAYQISALGTALTALYAAGGVTARAGMRAIEIRRQDKVVATLDLYDYLLRGEKHDDIRLETGDVVYVGLHGMQVRVTGAVRRPAIYELKPAETLPDLLRAAGGFGPDAALARLSLFRIVPVPERGTGPFPRAVVDVQLPVLGRAADDPPGSPAGQTFGAVLVPGLAMADGDSVVVDALPPLDRSYFVAIVGAVNRPGRYPWRAGMTLRDLMIQARGPEVGAYLKEAEIARQTVYVGGQVRFPGAYALASGRDRLADVLDRAGGLTPLAFAEGIRFVRAADHLGRINVDLPRALKQRDSRYNLVLQDGDSIVVPEYQPSVQVRGAVNAPGSVLWEKGKDVNFYVDAAGGASYKADKGRISVHFANGQVRTRHTTLVVLRSDPTPGPGSLIVVPERDLSVRAPDIVTVLGVVAQLVAASVTLAVVLKR